MSREKAFKEMIETIEEFGQCMVMLENEDGYGISPANHYIGGEEGYYMSSELGNVQYDDVEAICNDLLDFIGEEKIVEISVD